MSTDSPSTTDRLAERYSLDEIRAYLAGPPVVEGYRHHEDVDRMAWLLDLHDSVRDQLHRVSDENARLQERLDTAEREVIMRDGKLVGAAKAIDSLDAWRRNWKPLIDAHMKRCNGCDACDAGGGEDA